MFANTKEYGNHSEDMASRFLQESGFVIVERNYYARKLGEIDIIANKNGVVHFIEVKSSKGSFDPIYNITPSKLHKLINSAHYYLKTHKLDMAFCIDALIIRDGDIEFIENVTL